MKSKLKKASAGMRLRKYFVNRDFLNPAKQSGRLIKNVVMMTILRTSKR